MVGSTRNSQRVLVDACRLSRVRVVVDPDNATSDDVDAALGSRAEGGAGSNHDAVFSDDGALGPR